MRRTQGCGGRGVRECMQHTGTSFCITTAQLACVGEGKEGYSILNTSLWGGGGKEGYSILNTSLLGGRKRRL